MIIKYMGNFAHKDIYEKNSQYKTLQHPGCGIFNRNTNTVFDQQLLDAIIQGGTK